MVQILALREHYSEKRKSTVKSEVWFEKGIRASSVEDVLKNYKQILFKKVEESENFNIYYTVSDCLEERGRKLLRQNHIPFDVDKLELGDSFDISDEVLRPIAEVVCAAIGVDYARVGIVFSGNGLQFLVGTTHSIEDVAYFDQARPHYKAICDRITVALAKAGLQGQADVSVWSPARLMRMPGTNNVKPNKPKRMARVLQWEIERVDFQLEHASGLPKLQKGDSITVVGGLHDLITPDVKAILDPVKGCKFLVFTTTMPEKVSEPEWYASTSITGRFPEGRKYTHKVSEGHPGYSYQETENKIDQALSASGPRTCKSIEAISDKCVTCVHRGTNLVSPIRIEGPDHIKTEKTGFYNINWNKEGKVTVGKPAYDDLWKFFSKKHQYVSIRGVQTLYVYNGKFWEEMHKDDVLKFAQDNFNPKPSRNMRDEFFHYVKVHNLQDVDWFSKSITGFMNFQNGVYDIKTGQLNQHTGDYGFRSVLPCAYAPDAKATRFMQFMSEITLGRQELITILQEFMGYIFGNMDCEFEKALMMLGEGANGKSTLAKVIRALAGDATSNLSIKDMNNDQNRYIMEGKLVNIAEENSKDSFRDTENIKNFISGGIVRVKKLYSQPYEYLNRTKLVMLCNKLPSNMDQTHGFYRKLILVPFDATFDKRSKNMDTKITPQLLLELPGIFNFAMEGCKRLIHQGGFSDSVIIDDALDAYKTLTDSVKAWFEEDVEFSEDPEDKVSKQELYGSYTSYCDQTGVKWPVPQKSFAAEFKRLIDLKGHKYEEKRLGPRDSRMNYVLNLKIRKDIV